MILDFTMKTNRFLRFWNTHGESIRLLCILGLFVAGMYLLHIPCPIKLVTGISCPGCGMTRAYVSLLRWDLEAAFSYHPLWPLLPILLAVLPILRRKNMLAFRCVVWGFVAAMLGVYLLRMLVIQDPVLSCSPADGLVGRAIRFLQGLLSS